MITLTASNIQLTKNAKYSYLNDNYLSGISSIVITNSNGFEANNFILFGEFGSETAEIVKVSTVTAATHTLALAAATKFAHAESTKITIIPYNQVRFFHTTTTTFDKNDPVTGFINIQADDTVTKYADTVNTTGYGWFIFFNADNNQETTNSNAIPYAGFAENSVRNILDGFYSLLNNKEQKLITHTDAMRWLSEGYAKAKNHLNLIDNNYNVEAVDTILVTAGTREYDLEDNFGVALDVHDSSNSKEIKKIDLKDVSNYDESSGNPTKYYIRTGVYIGFSPLPTADMTVYLRYKSKADTLTSLYDNINLPNNNYYCLLDFLLYRASPKLNRPNAEQYFTMFMNGLNEMKLTSRQDQAPDSWSIADEANI